MGSSMKMPKNDARLQTQPRQHSSLVTKLKCLFFLVVILCFGFTFVISSHYDTLLLERLDQIQDWQSNQPPARTKPKHRIPNRKNQTTTTTIRHQPQQHKPQQEDDDDDAATTTFALLFPIGLLGGYRNQVMRFIAFLKIAHQDDRRNLLLPSVVFNTRYNDAVSKSRINQKTTFWPVPFDELFDVDHWNSYHHHYSPDGSNNNNDNNNNNTIALPLLVSSLPEPTTTSNEDVVCWKPSNDPEILSVPAVTKNPKHRSYVNNSAETLKSVLPLLTYRMLFGDDDDETIQRQQRPTFVLTVLQNQVLDYVLGTKTKKPQKIDFRSLTENCTHPYVYGGNNIVLWYTFLGMELRAPGVLPKQQQQHATSNIQHNNNNIANHQSDDKTYDGEPSQRTTTHRRLKAKRKQAKKPRDDAKARFETWFANTVDEALVPAKPWRQLADQCVRHHLGVQEDDHHGYIALHARIEPEMLAHRCGRDMERNLTKVIDSVEDLAVEYNSEHPRRRPLKGVFVAVGRDEMKNYEKYSKYEAIARYNWDILNHRSISYDSEGQELFTSSLEDSNNNNNNNKNHWLPIFECGEGWVEHSFYKNPQRQRNLFSPPTPDDANKPYGLYHRYGNASGVLPNNYFGDILPSIINFWLAVNADVFVGVYRSSWSNDIWTTRYYQGKGDRNYRYTQTGIKKISNHGLPPPHSCD